MAEKTKNTPLLNIALMILLPELWPFKEFKSCYFFYMKVFS